MSVRDSILASRLTRELTSSRDRHRRRESVTSIRARVEALRGALPPESSWRVPEREGVEPTLAHGGLYFHVHPQVDLATLATLPPEIPAVHDQAKQLASDVLQALERIQKDSELGQGERLDVLLGEATALLDRCEKLCSTSLKETLNSLEKQRAERLAQLVAGPASPMDTWVTGYLLSKARSERAALANEAALRGDTATLSGILRAPMFADVAGGQDIGQLAETWWTRAHKDDHLALDVARRIHEGAVKAASTIGEHLADAVNRAVASAVPQGLISASSPAQAQ